jgi:hypothetical protein
MTSFDRLKIPPMGKLSYLLRSVLPRLQAQNTLTLFRLLDIRFGDPPFPFITTLWHIRYCLLSDLLLFFLSCVIPAARNVFVAKERTDLFKCPTLRLWKPA